MTSPPDRGKPGGDDELFAQIVAGFSTPTEDPVPRWPVSEDVPAEAPDPGPPAPAPPPAPPAASLAPTPPDEDLPGWLEPEALEDEGHYEPPPAPKVPRVRPRTVLSWLLVLAGLAVLLAPYEVGLDGSSSSAFLGILLTSGGAYLLVSGLRDAPASGQGPDDGAVV